MTHLRTSANDLYRWLGIGALRRSDNLRLPSPRKAAEARRMWTDHVRWLEREVDGGDNDAA